LPRGPFCDDHRREFFGDEPVSDADRFLMLLRDNPALLPEAPDEATAAQMHTRGREEVHPCLRCGGMNQAALVAETTFGPRWLDLCWGCYSWVQRGATPSPLWPGR
jgi:hypothetical protein